jgi:hypothetical protein
MYTINQAKMSTGKPMVNPYSNDIYLDWVNNYVDYRTMAKDYGMTPEKMLTLITECRLDYECWIECVKTNQLQKD